MKKYLCLLICLLMVGCGHTVYTSSKGIGIDISWNPDTFVPSFRGGQYNVESFVPRGNSTMSMTTATGGILGTGGTSQTTAVSCGIQLNQGNITKIFNNPSVPAEAKVQFARTLGKIIRDPSPAPQTCARTTYAAGAVGPNAQKVQTQATGTDNIVNKIADHADDIKDITNNTVNKVGDSVDTLTVSTILASKWVLIVIIIAAVIVILILSILLKKAIEWLLSYFKNRKLTVISPALIAKAQTDKNILQNVQTVKSESITIQNQQFLSQQK